MRHGVMVLEKYIVIFAFYDLGFIVGDECFCEADCPMMWMVLEHFN